MNFEKFMLKAWKIMKDPEGIIYSTDWEVRYTDGKGRIYIASTRGDNTKIIITNKHIFTCDKNGSVTKTKLF